MGIQHRKQPSSSSERQGNAGCRQRGWLCDDDIQQASVPHAWGLSFCCWSECCLVSLMASETMKTNPKTIPSGHSCQKHSTRSPVGWTACTHRARAGATPPRLMRAAFHAVRPLYNQIMSHLNLCYTILDSEAALYITRESQPNR